VNLGDGIYSVGSGAFANCPALLSIDVSPGNNQFSSQNGVLFDKNQITLLQFPSGTSFTFTYIVPDSVQTISERAFAGCYNLNSVVIPESVYTIGDYAFEGCSNLNMFFYQGNQIFYDHPVFDSYSFFSLCNSLSLLLHRD